MVGVCGGAKGIRREWKLHKGNSMSVMYIIDMQFPISVHHFKENLFKKIWVFLALLNYSGISDCLIHEFYSSVIERMTGLISVNYFITL